MKCWNCGADLREGARFCNQCGERQPADSTPQEEPLAVGQNASESSAADSSGETTHTGYAKRPPRPIRAQHDTIPVGMDPVALPDDTTTPADNAVPPEPASESASEQESAESDQAALDHQEHNAMPDYDPRNGWYAAKDENAPLEDQPTMEYSTIAESGVPLDATPVVAAGRQTATLRDFHPHGMESPADGLPWPLVPSIIVGGRYRVEAVVIPASSSGSGENVYRVRDLQGYERCWSCGEQHGPSAASDQFCTSCGADMLARDFLMYERLQLAERDDAATVPDETTASEEVTPTDAADSAQEADDERDTATSTPDERIFSQGLREYRVVAVAPEPELFPHGVRLSMALATDPGVTRAGDHDEDTAGFTQLTLATDDQLHTIALAIVADGLGGHENGQEASNLVVRMVTARMIAAIGQTMGSSGPQQMSAGDLDGSLMRIFTESIQQANEALMAANAQEHTDRGSTIVAALIWDATAFVAHVGDSRAYVLDDADIRRLTMDHSLVEQLIASGMITPEERYTHPQRNQILRSLGDESGSHVDIVIQKLRPGMRLLLCSDGLWEMVRDEAIEDILRSTQSPEEACQMLIARANENGGEDNIAALVLNVAG